ncbi:MAG: hypothetical protein CL583_13280 [Alteromonadaceae bacterium]|nr:hypothetical protein [Alteromonadaceae bacterium]|tara:strand:+ start:607 stop:1014 length:408 start_codon:yes stop_codon:yes gene_type:complete
MAEYEPLRREHFEGWDEAHKHWVRDVDEGHLVGFAAREKSEILCIGGLYANPDDGRLWAVFSSRGRPPPSVHKVAHKIVEAARTAGASEIWAELDETRPRAREWLLRFGFEETAEAGPMTRWRLDLGRPQRVQDK